jgi:hypothetical protein
MSPAETFETRKRLVTPSPAKLRESAGAISKTYVLFIYGNIRYITNSFCTDVLSPSLVRELHFNTLFPVTSVGIYIACNV